ncbi:MAG: hypothetical protein JNL54_13665 [Kineosporiaceae bacterium]|nr:hypothetical protein [Kineosporiaceae bacterium]
MALVIFTSGDLALIKSTLDHVLRLAERYSWVVAISLATLSVALMLTAGVESRLAGDPSRPRPGGLTIGRALVGVWLLLGLALLVMRWNSGMFSRIDPSFEGATESVKATPDHLMALLLLAVHAATGALAWTDGWRMTNPVAAVARLLHRRERKLLDALPALLGRVARIQEQTVLHRRQVAAIEQERDEALAANTYLFHELQSEARVRIAELLGNPAATGVTRQRAVSEDGPR